MLDGENFVPIVQALYKADVRKELQQSLSGQCGRKLKQNFSYGLGASIIRMMDHFLTTETFRRGLIAYLNAKAYSNAETKELWEFLNTAAEEDDRLPQGVTVNDVMSTWTELTGYPVVTLTRSPTDDTATLTQVCELNNIQPRG